MTAKTADYFRQTEKVITTKRTTLVKSKRKIPVPSLPNFNLNPLIPSEKIK